MVGRIYRISRVCRRTTGTNAYRNANIVRHVPKPHLIELHAISLLSDFFPLWPLSTSGTISSAAIIMYKCYPENWQFCGDQFNVSPLRGKAGSSADVDESATCLEVSQVQQTWYFSIFIDARSASVHVVFCRCSFIGFFMTALVGQTAERIFTNLSHVVDIRHNLWTY